MPRKMKVTKSPDNKAYQNRRTEMVEKATEDLQPLQTSPPSYMKGTIAGRAWQTPIYKSVQNNRGEIIDRDFVGFKKNPAVSTMDAAIRQIRSLSSELGLTPTSRASLLSLTTDDEDDDGPILADVLGSGDDF